MLSKRVWIEEKDIQNKVDDGSIFERYFGEFEVGSGCYHSPFREDNNPSTGFYVNSSGRIIYNDFATKEKLDAVHFVMKLYNINYRQALVKIATDFGMVESNGTISDIPKITSKVASKKKDKIYQVGYKDFDEKGKEFWEQFHITPKELDENSVFQVANLYVNGIPFPSYPDKPRFCYLIQGKDKEYIKVYSPFDERQYKWLSSSPIFLPFGIYETPFESDTLIITKSQKDRIVLKKFFTDVIAVQSENTAALLERTAKYLKGRYNRIIIWFDNDPPGIEAGKDYEKQFGFTSFHFPEFFRTDHGVKDASDFVKKWGVDNLHNYIKQNNL